MYFNRSANNLSCEDVNMSGHCEVRFSLFKKRLGEDVSSAEDSIRIEGAFNCGHVAQLSVTVKETQVVALQFSHAVLCRKRSTDSGSMFQELHVQLTRACAFSIVA